MRASTLASQHSFTSPCFTYAAPPPPSWFRRCNVCSRWEPHQREPDPLGTLLRFSGRRHDVSVGQLLSV
eukprot:520425-Rhodomonas_salina.2